MKPDLESVGGVIDKELHDVLASWREGLIQGGWDGHFYRGACGWYAGRGFEIG